MEKRVINALLFDIDGTLLDFEKGELEALEYIFKICNIPFNKDNINIFKKINYKHWSMLERKEINKEYCLTHRFTELFEILNIKNVDVVKISKLFQIELSKKHYLFDNALLVLNKLHQKYKIYIITNGVSFIQHARLKDSNIINYVDGVFISEEINYVKPDVDFFNYVLNKINLNKDEVVIIGDSLSSDIQGGINSNIDTILVDINHLHDDYKNKKVNNLIDLLNYL